VECLVWMLRLLVPASSLRSCNAAEFCMSVSALGWEQEGNVGREIVREAIVQHCKVTSSREKRPEKRRHR